MSLDIGIHELDSRSTDGIAVVLLWSAHTEEVFVDVADTRTGDTFRVRVDAADALDAFAHPYAYAPRHRHEHAPSPDVRNGVEVPVECWTR
jgi:hypothetical protein